jgi:hypothetical protein
VIQRNRSAAIRRNFIQPTRLVRSFWKPRRDSRRGCYRGIPGVGPGFGESTETGDESVAAAYLKFAASSPALYEVMFLLSLSVPFGKAATPPELRFAFSQLLESFQGQSSKAEVLSELFWASLHGIAELSRTKRFPRSRQKERVRALDKLFTFPR